LESPPDRIEVKAFVGKGKKRIGEINTIALSKIRAAGQSRPDPIGKVFFAAVVSAFSSNDGV